MGVQFACEGYFQSSAATVNVYGWLMSDIIEFLCLLYSEGSVLFLFYLYFTRQVS